MKLSVYKSYDDLPLFLNAEIGPPAKLSTAVLPGRGGAAEQPRPAACGWARDV